MKKWFLLLFIPVASSASAPIVTPSTPVVNVGGTVGLTANVAVTWSLAAGSSGSISAAGLYTAPTTFFTANNYLQQAGVVLRPNDDVINTRIDQLPVSSSSSVRFAHMFTVNGGSNAITFEPTIPTNLYHQNMPTQNITFRSSSQNNGSFIMLSTFSRLEEGSVMSDSPLVKDHHLIGVTSDTYHSYELYQLYAVGGDPGSPTSNSTSGVERYMNQFNLPDISAGGGSASDAAGMMVEPILLRFSEVESGQIKHALRGTLNNANLYNLNSSTAGIALWPATNHAFTSDCQSGLNCFPYGSRIRLKAAYGCGRMSSRGQAICNAMKTYGFFLVDGGTTLAITSAWDSVESTQAWTAQFGDFTTTVSTVSSSDLEQVDESSLQISTFTGNVNPANGFVTPPQFAQVIAKNNADLTVSSVSIALIPVTVGWKNPVHQGLDTGINVMARTPQFLIESWVNGSTDTAFNCSMSPTVGSISSNTAGCLYTAPTSQYNQMQITTVTIASRIDPTHNPASFYITVFSTDGIRIRMSDAISGADTKPPFDDNGIFTDTSGNSWFEEPVNNIPPWNQRTTQGSASWPNQMYNHHATGIATDKLWGWMLPTNPNDSTGTYTSGTWIVQSNHGVSSCCGEINASTNTIETQNGLILFSSVSLVTAVLTPRVFVSTITTTTNSLYYAIRSNNDGGSSNFISYLSVMFSSATAPASPAGSASPPGMTWQGTQRWTGNIKIFDQ